MTVSKRLLFGKPNSKTMELGKVWSFDLSAGKTCPFAQDCHSTSVLNKETNRLTIKDGPSCKFRCYAATIESLYIKTYLRNAHNTRIIKNAKSAQKIADKIQASLPKKADYIRIHTSGDFFNQEYFDAWIIVARNNPATRFYAYTKSLPYWVKRLEDIPPNLNLTASYGGKYDYLISTYNLKSVKVIKSEDEARALNLPIDHDDSHAAIGVNSFAVLIHGVQPIGTEWAKARYKLSRIDKIGQYNGKGRNWWYSPHKTKPQNK
jgi:hypothetical protein